jgi:hypothetical protein
MMLGYKTRTVTILSWLMMLSMHNRNPLILQGGDDLLRMSLFWGMFLPWGKFYSIDSYHTEQTETKWFGFSGIGYMVLVFSVYFFSALLKNSSEWHTEGTAIYYALSLDQMVLPPGRWLYNFPLILKYMTLGVYYTELIVPFLFFSPVYTKQLRLFAILGLTALHIGIASTLFVGLFFLIGLATLIGILPSTLIDKIHYDFVTLKKYTLTISQKYLTQNNFRATKNLGKSFKLISESALVAIIIYTTIWNWQTTSYSSFTLNDKPIAQAGVLLGINQNWGMFAPCVFKDDGWFILEATTEKGKKIDLNRNGKVVSYKKPFDGVSLFKNDRWRKYTENYLFVSNNYMRPYYCNFLIDHWNIEHPNNKIKDLKVVYMKEVTQPNYKQINPSKEILAEVGR